MISFPGIGIGPFSIDPVAFKVFGLTVRWYGLIICIGMIFSLIYIVTRIKYEKIKTHDFVDLAIFTIIFGVIGARIYYVLFELDSYIVPGDFWESVKKMVAVWEGGIAIYGAIIGGFITVFVVCRIKKLRFSTVLDAVAPGVMIGQIIGRWGNFVNMEAHGGETALPWRMGLSTTGDVWNYYHPTFLYESLWNLIGFVLIAIFYKKKKFNGQVFLFYIAWYGFGRMFIEGLRTDSLYLHVFGLDIRISQIVGFATFVIGLVLTIVNLVKVKKHKISLAASPYLNAVEAKSFDLAPSTDDNDEILSEDGVTTENVDGESQASEPLIEDTQTDESASAESADPEEKAVPDETSICENADGEDEK